MKLIQLLEKKDDRKLVVVYPGRFQPFHRGHLSAYRWLCKKFGKENVWIATSNKTEFDSEKKINIKPQQRRAGYLFQSYALFPNITVRQNIMAGLRTGDKKERNNILESCIESFRLNGLEDRYPSQLSGGQKQRVALARLIASQPEILLLDEPLSALDEDLRMNTEKEIEKVMDKVAGTIFVSHSRGEVARLCDEVAFVKNGIIDGTASAAELMTLAVRVEKQ